MKTNDQEQSDHLVGAVGGTTVADRARTVFAYTMSLTALCIAAGMVQGIGRYIFFGKESARSWGQFDTDSAIPLVLNLIISACVYWHLARRHKDDFLVLGAAIAALQAILNLAFSMIFAPTGTHMQGWLIGVTVIIYGIVMLVSGIAFGAITLKRGKSEKHAGEIGSRAVLAPVSRMAQCGAVPFAVLTLSFSFSSFFSLREVAEKPGAQGGLEFLLSLIVHLIAVAVFIYITWRTYRRPTILLVSVAVVYAAADFVATALLMSSMAKFWIQAIALAFGLVGLRGVLKARGARSFGGAKS
jgi:hypothetical protein